MLAHLKSRGVQPTRYQLYYDEEVTHFLLFNLSGQIIGYQQYRPAADKTRKNDPRYGRYYTYCGGGSGGVWGLETFYYSRNTLFITEGIFDAVKLHNLELPAIAALANNPKHIWPWLKIVRETRTIIGICDDDEAGRKLRSVCDLTIACPDGKDLGDMTNEEVKDLLCQNLKRLSSLI
jgi:hypothetical protein